MKKRNLPLVLLFVMIFFASCGNGCGNEKYKDKSVTNNSSTIGKELTIEPTHAAIYAVMGKPDVSQDTIGLRHSMCSGAGICTSNTSLFPGAIQLDFTYDPGNPSQITLSFSVADMSAQQNGHYVQYFAGNPVSYTFDGDYVFPANVCAQLGVSAPATIPASTSTSLVNDGTTVTFVMPFQHQ